MIPFPEFSVTNISLAFLAILVCLFYWYSTNTFDYWKKKGVIYEPPTPLFGNIKDTLLMRRNFCEVHDDLYKKYEGHPFIGIYHARKPALFISDPELIRAVLVKDFQHFHDRDFITHPKRNPLQQNLFIITGHKWRVLRTKLSPTFTSGRMKGMFPLMEESSKNLISYLEPSAEKGDIIEMKDILAKFSTDIIGSCAFGLQMNALDDPNSEFRRMGRRIFETSITKRLGQMFNTVMPELAKYILASNSRNDMSDFFIRLVKETVDYRLKHNIVRNDFVQLLMNLKFKGSVDVDEDKELENGAIGKENGFTVKANGTTEKKKDDMDLEMDDGLMAAQAMVFFAAGFETSSTTMSFALHELALNPEIQTKLREEIDASLEQTGGKFTYESIMNMKYLDKVVSETMRMYPAVMFLRRSVTTPYTVPGTQLHLEKGMAVFIPVFSLHRDPKHYPNPERFDPERFSEKGKASRHNYVYLPFGEGPRNCIGMRFGLMQTKLGLASLLSKFEFHVCERSEIPIRLHPKSLVLSSTTGTVVRITNRTSSNLC